ncbi:protein kinase domain-containing protein [Deferrisoma camini]|uniref:protein kinase domain-containing protein n=1 Tax=Deferrisoma camini TaxID=1035120 RepID=UPI00046D842A|nr:serine/threonine-protein kinase [Deferrisoma camini]
MKDVGPYRIVGKLGQGGMATVYKGVQTSLDRPVAVKVIAQSLADDPELRERFRRESLIIARLTHPNIIHVIDRGITRDGRPYFVMEYVEGTDLARLIREGGLDTNRKLDLMTQVCKALAYAHKNGVIHRDIKPGNILVDLDGNARVLDFGIAQFADESRVSDSTQAGVVMGTLAYMSPEQKVDSRAVTPASDIYSLGAVMYELFTGGKPGSPPKPPSALRRDLPEALDELILRCLDPDPARRPLSADVVRDRLLQILRGAHIAGDQRRRAGQGMARIGEKFALLDVLKEDRYGAVYLYENREDHSLLVIKRKPAGSQGYTEARMLTALRHPNIASVLGTSQNDQFYIVVMEYLSGGSLRDRLVRPLPWPEAARIARGILQGLAFAHRNRIVHGNLRPSNVLFGERGDVKLTDFGLDEHYADPSGPPNWYGIRGEERSVRADLFAVGVMLFEMLAGQRPRWDGGTLVETEGFQAAPQALADLVRRLLALAPDGRPATADAALEVLERLEEGPGEDTGAPTVVLGAGEGPAAAQGAGAARGPAAWGRRVGMVAALAGAAVAGYWAHALVSRSAPPAVQALYDQVAAWVKGWLPG